MWVEQHRPFDLRPCSSSPLPLGRALSQIPSPHVRDTRSHGSPGTALQTRPNATLTLWGLMLTSGPQRR
ncbi:hypothetical protein KUCAC02_028198, partial [Chaenocephalus aceratus]